MEIGEKEIAAYVDEGYLVVPGLVSSDEIEAIRQEVSRFARGEYPILNPPPESKTETGKNLEGEILAVHFPHWVSSVIRDFITHPGISDVLQKITAAHLPHWDGSVKCMQSMLFSKAPGLPGQAWHQDEHYITTRDRSLVGAWIAVDDANESNGCLRVIPGSQRNGYLWPTRAHGRPEEFDPSDESHAFDESEEILVEVEAGSVVFFNGYLLHRSLRNRSAGYRRALVNHYCNAWSLLPWSTAPLEKIHLFEIATRDERNIVPLGEDPYAWKGYAEMPGKVFLRPHKVENRPAEQRGKKKS